MALKTKRRAASTALPFLRRHQVKQLGTHVRHPYAQGALSFGRQHLGNGDSLIYRYAAGAEGIGDLEPLTCFGHLPVQLCDLFRNPRCKHGVEALAHTFKRPSFASI